MAKQYDQDAFAYLRQQLRDWGLDSLAHDVQEMLKAGSSADRIQIELQEKDAYRRRFAGNEARRQKGLPVLAPAEYLAVESSYRQVMQAAGLPPGFYDKPNDFEKWIADDVSPTEIQGRVTAAQKLVESADPGVRQEFERLYGKGNLVAYALDRSRTQALLEKQAEAARLSDAAEDSGFGGLQERRNAERLVEAGISEVQARAGFAQARRQMETFGRLGRMAGVDYGRGDAFEDVFFNDEDAAAERRGLLSQERARFGGSAGVTGGSLGQRSQRAL